MFAAFSTFVCPTEITAFSDRCAEFQKLNAELIACSCDSHFSHLAWTQTPRSEGGLGDMQVDVLHIGFQVTCLISILF